MKNLQMLSSLASVIAFSGYGSDGFGSSNKTKLRIEDIDVTPIQPPIPKGCKEYFFNHLGDFINHNDGIYAYKCIAISDKSALKKFEKWVKNLV